MLRCPGPLRNASCSGLLNAPRLHHVGLAVRYRRLGIVGNARHGRFPLGVPCAHRRQALGVALALVGALAQFFDLAPLIRASWGIEPNSPEHIRGYANAMVEMFLEGASVRLDEDGDPTVGDPDA